MTETTANEAKTFTVTLTEQERVIVLASLGVTFEEAVASAVCGEEMGQRYLEPIAETFLKVSNALSV
jgi:hypothetical protein